MFEKIGGMIGSLLRLAHDTKHIPVFHTGGIVSPEALDKLARSRSHHFMPRGHIIFEGNPLFGGRMADDLAQRRNADKIFHITMTPPQSRKRPITDDMAQMCQDLGIEPSMGYEDFRKELEKTLYRSMGIPRPMLLEAGLSWNRLQHSRRPRW